MQHPGAGPPAFVLMRPPCEVHSSRAMPCGNYLKEGQTGTIRLCRIAIRGRRDEQGRALMNSQPATMVGAEMSSEEEAVRETVVSEALPIWAKQIESARDQTEEAIVALTARFEGIVSRLDRALGAVGSGTGTKAIAEDA